MSDETPRLASAKYEVRRLAGGAERDPWDGFVRRSPQGSPFAMRAWLEASAAQAGAAVDWWVAFKGQEWVAAVPIAYRMRLGRAVHFGLPLSAYSGFLYRPPSGGHPASAAHEHLQVTQALVAAIRPSYALVSLLLSPAIEDVRPWTWAGWRAVPRYTYRIELATDLRLADSVRRHVRKCEEAGFTLGDAWDLGAFWSAFEESRERQGFGIRMTRGSFERLASALHQAELAWMLTVRDARGDVAASQILLSSSGAPGVYMWVAGTRAAQLQSGASAWLMVGIAAEARRRGYAFWDLCGADYPAIARFKAELGGRLQAYYQLDAPRSWLERRLRESRDLVARLSRHR